MTSNVDTGIGNNRPIGKVHPMPRLTVEDPVQVVPNDQAQVDYDVEDLYEVETEEGTDSEEEAHSDDEFLNFPNEEFYDFPQQSANDQESTEERDYIKISPSVTVQGVIHDRIKGWQFRDLLAYIDFDQDVNVITRHALRSMAVPKRFIKRDEHERVKVMIQLVINHEVFNAEFYVIDDYVHRKPVPLSGSRWRNVRQLKLAHNYRENANHSYGAILGFKFYSFINLHKTLFNDASLLIQETKLGYIISGYSKKTDLPIMFFGSSNDNDSDTEEYDPQGPRADNISVDTGSTFYPCDILNYQGPRTFVHRRLILHDRLFSFCWTLPLFPDISMNNMAMYTFSRNYLKIKKMEK